MAALVAGIAAVAGLFAGIATGGEEPKPTTAGRPAVAPFEHQLQAELTDLAAIRAKALNRLRDAATADVQERASLQLAQVHRRSAGAIADLSAAGLQSEQDAIVESLRDIAVAYSQLGRAARHEALGAYESGEVAVRDAEAGLGRQLESIEDARA